MHSAVTFDYYPLVGEWAIPASIGTKYGNDFKGGSGGGMFFKNVMVEKDFTFPGKIMMAIFLNLNKNISNIHFKY